MLLNADQMEYLDSTADGGFVVAFHQNGVPGFPVDFGTSIPIGFVSSVGIEMVICTLTKLLQKFI